MHLRGQFLLPAKDEEVRASQPDMQETIVIHTEGMSSKRLQINGFLSDQVVRQEVVVLPA
jgi:hypothetical protein